MREDITATIGASFNLTKKFNDEDLGNDALSGAEPNDYSLRISTFLYPRLYFEGHFKIRIHVTSRTKSLTLHSKDLKILEESLKLHKFGRKMKVTGIMYNFQRDTMTIHFQHNLGPVVELSGDYCGNIFDMMTFNKTR